MGVCGRLRRPHTPHLPLLIEKIRTICHTTERGGEMEKQLSIAAVVTAGWSPKEDDPLAEYTQAGTKATIPIAGKPMINHVVDALSSSRYIAHYVIVALPPSAGARFPVSIDYLPDAGGLVENVRSGIEYALNRFPDADAALLCGSDIPTITPAIGH